MITTKTNLRATATEAYDKGWAAGAASRGRADDTLSWEVRWARARGRREGEQAVRAYVLEELRRQHEEIHLALGKAETRWEKRLLSGRLDGITAAIKIVTFAA